MSVPDVRWSELHGVVEFLPRGDRDGWPWRATAGRLQDVPDAQRLVPVGPLRKLAAECSADSILTAAWAGDALTELLDELTDEDGGTT